MKQKKLIFIFIIGILQSSFAQVTDITWQQCFETVDNYSETYCISEFNNGYLVGMQVNAESEGVSNYHGGSDAWFVCLDTLGNVIWEKCYGGSSADVPQKIIPIDSNYCYLMIYSSSVDGDVQGNNSDEGLIWVVKIDTTGNILWQQCYGYGSRVSPRDAILTPDGGLLLLCSIFAQGENVSTYYGSNDVWLWKINTRGDIEWETTIGTPGTDNGFKVMLTSDNTYLALCGVNANGGMSGCELNGFEYSSLDVWLLEYDLDGNILSQDCYGGTEWDNAVNFAETEDGYVIVTATDSWDGDVSGNHGGLGDIWVLVLDKDKQIQWEKCYGGRGDDYPRYVTQTGDGGYIVVGMTDTQNNGDVEGNHSIPGHDDIWVFKADSLGELQWQRCFGGRGTNRFWGYNCVLKRNDNNYVFAALGPGIDGDQLCTGGGGHYAGWIFEIKDCTLYAPHQPLQPTGTDTLCVNTDSITTYTTQQATNAWYYQWQLQPEEAGTITGDSLTAIVNWNPNYEGPALLKVRSSNDCGESAWSDSLIIQAYTCLGTDDNDIENSLRVYPNPATNTLIIEKQNHNKPYNIEIYNSTGTKVFTTNTATKITSIDVSEWISGVYVVKIVSGNDCFSRKIVVI